jgi:hypothetical protein
MRLLLFVLISTIVVSSQSQLDHEPIKCQLSVEGYGDRLGIAQANLSCEGGTICMHHSSSTPTTAAPCAESHRRAVEQWELLSVVLYVVCLWQPTRGAL